ncbi:MAG: DUF5916 domain-containing protein [Gemmatimonadaceae bacterium]
MIPPMLSLSLLSLAASVSAAPVYHGRTGTRDVAIPRMDSSVVIDGALTEGVWATAAVLTGFSRYAPTDGFAADDSTDVMVWYSPTAIYFGVRAYAEPGSVRATLSDRDKMFGDDYVGIFLSTFNDGRQALVFGANPLGVQGDGIVVESGRSTSSGFSGPSIGREPTDVSPDFVFQSKGHVTEYGYEIEIRIPFKSLKYQSADPQTWGIQVLRKVQSRGFEYTWTPAQRAAASFLGQSGHLVGLTNLSRGLVLDLNPVVTEHWEGTAGPDGFSRSAENPKFGANVRWGITNNLTLSGTMRPDFAEVESDAGQFVFDPRAALFFPEKRPFFLEGSEQFETPGGLVYTRRILSPIAATKVTGKLAGTNVAFLSAVDDKVASVSGEDHPVFNILRVKRDLGRTSRVGLILTDREEGDRSNRVGGGDFRFVFNKIYSVSGVAAVSRTAVPNAATRVAPLWSTTVARAGRMFGARYNFSGIDDNFRASAGFISRGAIAYASAQHSLTLYGRNDGFVQSATGDITLDDTWAYQRFVNGDDAIEKKMHFNTNFQLRGGWHAGASLLLEKFGFDPAFYSGYAIERHTTTGIDTIAFTGRPRIPNRDYVLTLDSPQFRHVGFNVFWVWGQDENFFEWASADIGFLSLGMILRPTGQLRVESTYNLQYYKRRTDGSTVGSGKIPRVKVEYQLARSIFLRAVGQYNAQFQADLRDDSRTNDPLLVRNQQGVYERALRYHDNSFQGDLLFSYLPTPGTVVYLGYGSTSTEDRAFRFREMQRQHDGFFVKMSYLFRV